jgi:hypothetical protein
MGFNKPTWTPGHERNAVSGTHFKRLAEMRERRAQHMRQRLAARQLEGSLLSLAALLGAQVRDEGGDAVGELRDVVVRWTAGIPYPRMTAIVLRAGKRDVAIGAPWIELAPPASVRLRSSKAYARAFERHPTDVALAHDVLDHQVVDAAGTQIVRPADVYLAEVDGEVEALGIEVGVEALLRRLGPACFRRRIRPRQVIDWRDIASFASMREGGRSSRGRGSDMAGRPGTALELGANSADVRRLDPTEVRAALRAYKTRGDTEAK